MMTEQPKQTNQQPFEQLLNNIESIVRELESNELPLDEALNKFEQGVALSRAASARLESAERRIEEILADGQTQKVSGDE